MVTIIVGVATVVAINIFGQSAENANVDALRQDVLTLAAMSQGWYIKPELMGGGGGTFVEITVDELGFGYDTAEAGGQTFTNANGDFAFSAISATGLTITGTSRVNPDVSVVAVVGTNEIVSLDVLGRDVAGG